MGCSTRELREKSVISLCDGRCLGNICDYEIDPCSGKIEAIYVPGGGGFFGRSEDIRIPWCDISQIGEDAILVNVDLPKTECAYCRDSIPRKKHRWF